MNTILPSLKLVLFLSLPIAGSVFCKALEDTAGVAHKVQGYPRASVSHPKQRCPYRSIEALDVPPLPHPE